MNKRDNWFERNPRKTIISVIVVLVIGIDFLSAKAYHEFTRRFDPVTAEQAYRIKIDPFHHGFAPNKSFRKVIWGPRTYPIQINSLGFKDESVRDVPIVSDTHRILFIGDSFTEGVGVAYPDTFVGLIDRALANEGIEVFNAAVSSYSPIIYWRKIKYLLEEVGFKINEVVVYLDISDPEDEAIYYYLDPDGKVVLNEVTDRWYFDKVGKSEEDASLLGRQSSKSAKLNNLKNFVKEYIKNNSVLLYTSLKTARHIFRQLAKSKDAKPGDAINFQRGCWTTHEELFDDYGRLGLSKMEHYMTQLLILLQKHGVKLSVAVYPWPDQIIRNDLHSIQVSFWEAWCKKHKVPFLNYFPFLIDPSNADRNSIIDRYFIAGDIHVNEAGHRLVADHFLAFYTSKK